MNFQGLLSLLCISLLLLFTGCSGDPELNGDPDVGGFDDVDIENDVDDETPVPIALVGVAPAEGSIEGGTTVTLSGEGFLDGMTVYFGENEALSVTRHGGLSAQAVSPPGDVGTVDVRVENPDAQSATLADAFSYIDDGTSNQTNQNNQTNHNNGNGDAIIGFCQTETQNVESEPGQDTSSITGLVYVDGITPGEGRGDGVEGRILWGSLQDSPTDWTEVVDANYLDDADGLNPGDLSNDRYEATLNVADEGSYGFIYQFRVDDGDWVSCDTEGSEDFNDELVGTLVVEEATVAPFPAPESCGIQFPLIAQAIDVGADISVFGRVYEPGVTDLQDLPEELLGEVLYGLEGTDLQDMLVVDGSRNPTYIGDDFEEFEAIITPAEVGVYIYVFRFSLDEGDNWTYCQIDGMSEEDDVDSTRFGAIFAFDDAPNLIDYCRTWSTDLTAAPGADAPEISMELYEEDVTDDNQVDNSAQLEVQAGYGLPGTNPALAGYGWAPLTYTEAIGNNYQFAGDLYGAANTPAPGEYQAMTRARLVGEEAWTYCNVDPGQGDFFLELATDFVVEP